MLRVYNNTARYVDQGGNKRPGAFAIYLEPWHADVYEFLDCRKNTGMYGTVKCKIFKIRGWCISVCVCACARVRVCVSVLLTMHSCGFFVEKSLIIECDFDSSPTTIMLQS